MHVVTATTPRTHRAAEDQQRNKRTCAEMVSSLEKKKFTGCCCSTDGSFQKKLPIRAFIWGRGCAQRPDAFVDCAFQMFAAAHLECSEIFVNDVRRVCAPDGGIHVLGTPLHHLSALAVLSSAPSCDDLLTRLCGIVKVGSTAG